MGSGGPYPGVKRGRGVTLTTYHHLVLRSRMSTWYTYSLPSDSMACSGTALFYFTLHIKIMACTWHSVWKLKIKFFTPLLTISLVDGSLSLVPMIPTQEAARRGWRLVLLAKLGHHSPQRKWSLFYLSTVGCIWLLCSLHRNVVAIAIT
jgi:hypothetical protein